MVKKTLVEACFVLPAMVGHRDSGWARVMAGWPGVKDVHHNPSDGHLQVTGAVSGLRRVRAYCKRHGYQEVDKSAMYRHEAPGRNDLDRSASKYVKHVCSIGWLPIPKVTMEEVRGVVKKALAARPGRDGRPTGAEIYLDWWGGGFGAKGDVSGVNKVHPNWGKQVVVVIDTKDHLHAGEWCHGHRVVVAKWPTSRVLKGAK